MKPKTKFYLIFVLILVLATSLRFYNITATSLWHDEAFSALLIKYPWSEMFYRIGLDVHPALYYIILRLWYYFFGDSLFSLRAFSAIFGILTVWGVYLLTKEVFNRKKLALLAACFVAVNPFQIIYSVEARMYTLGTFILIFASYFLIKALNSGKFKDWVWYAIFLAASFHIHYFLFFSVFAHFVYILYWIIKGYRFNIISWFNDKKFLSFCGSWIFAGVLFLPWLSWFLRQVRQVQEQYWIPKMGWLSVPSTFYKMITGGDINSEKYWYVAIFAFFLGLVIITYALKKSRTEAGWFMLLMLGVPFTLAILMSLKTSLYLDRYFVFASLFYLILIAVAIFYIPNKKIAGVLIAFFLILSFVSFTYNWASLNVKEKPGMAGAAKYLNQKATKEDKILVGSSFIFFTFRYYNQTNIEPKLFVPGELPHFSGSALLASKDDPQKLENTFKDFNTEVKSKDTVWVLWTTGFGASKPKEIPLTWRETEEISFQDVYGYRGQIIVSKYLIP